MEAAQTVQESGKPAELAKNEVRSSKCATNQAKKSPEVHLMKYEKAELVQFLLTLKDSHKTERKNG